jgi:hypothetical protein
MMSVYGVSLVRIPKGPSWNPPEKRDSEPVMLYVGIDQHRKQLTISVRDESGNVTLRRQVSTKWEKARAFFDGLREQSSSQGGYVAVVEICGFNRPEATHLVFPFGISALT